MSAPFGDPSGLEVLLYRLPKAGVFCHVRIVNWNPDTGDFVVYDGAGADSSTNLPAGTKGGRVEFKGLNLKTQADLDAFMQKELRCDNTPGLKISTGGKTFKEEDEALKNANKAMRQVEQYNPVTGPNSNTFAHQLLLNAGFPNPEKVPAGAIAWNYSGFYRYGGPVYDKNGIPIHKGRWIGDSGLHGGGIWLLPNGDRDPNPPHRPAQLLPGMQCYQGGAYDWEE